MFRNTLDKMIQIRDEKKAEDGGFTLIELLVVVVIIGILIAIAIPLYLNYEHGAKDKSAESDLKAAVTAVQQCYTDNNNSFPTTAAGGDDADMTFNCPDADNQETATVSSGTTLTYAFDDTTNVYTLTATNDGGSGKTYTYASDAGSITTS